MDKNTQKLYDILCEAPTGSVKTDMSIGTLKESHTHQFIETVATHLNANIDEIFAERIVNILDEILKFSQNSAHPYFVDRKLENVRDEYKKIIGGH